MGPRILHTILNAFYERPEQCMRFFNEKPFIAWLAQTEWQSHGDLTY